jgi:hypothetical protein
MTCSSSNFDIPPGSLPNVTTPASGVTGDAKFPSTVGYQDDFPDDYLDLSGMKTGPAGGSASSATADNSHLDYLKF